MTFQLSAGGFFVFMFAMVRASAWLAFVPPFSSSAIPLVVRTGLAASLGLAVTSELSGGPAGAMVKMAAAVGNQDTAAFISDLVLQAVTGAVLGFITSILFSVVSAAGSLTDMTSGLSASTTFDPISGTLNPVTANTFNVIMTTLLFATGGDLLVVKGFLTSFRSIGLTSKSVGLLGTTLMSEVGFFFLAAVEIAAPAERPPVERDVSRFRDQHRAGAGGRRHLAAAVAWRRQHPRRPGCHRHAGPARPQALRSD